MVGDIVDGDDADDGDVDDNGSWFIQQGQSGRGDGWRWLKAARKPD